MAAVTNPPILNGLTPDKVHSIPKDWNPAWFRRFIRDFLEFGDIRNATAGSNITITPNAGGVGGGPPTISASGGGSTGVPATIADLAYWFTADAPLMSSGKTYPILTNYAPNTLGGIAGGGTATRSATQLNGHGVCAFPGTVGSSYALDFGVSLNSGATIFAVWLAAAGANSGGSPFISGPSGCLELRAETSTNAISLLKSQVALIGTSSSALTVGTAYQFNATYDGTSAYAFRIARAPAGSGSTAATITAASTVVGSDSTGATLGRLTGSLAELAVYSRVLSNTEIGLVEAYLLAKWGV